MNEIIVNTSASYSVPSGATKLSIQHEWGDLLITNATVSGSYAFTPDSIGVHSFIWNNNSNVLIKKEYYLAVQKYCSSSEYLADYPQYSALSAKFDAFEKRTRHLIESFVKQKFGPYKNKTLKVQGDGGDALYIPERILSYTSLTDSFGTDLTIQTEVSPGSEYFIRRVPRNYNYYTVGPSSAIYDVDVKHDITKDIRDFFTDALDFLVLGNFGWDYVPVDITEAIKLLITDQYSGRADQRNSMKQGELLGDFSYSQANGRWYDPYTTTGNVDADFLLSGYININLGLA